jgi:L-rhamnose-H+ transport protein
MIIANPLEGIGLHAVGATSASACYLPFHKTKNWSWVSFWLVQALFAWILTPLLLAVLTVPDFFSIIQHTSDQVLIVAFLLGAFYGFGGMSFGFAIRHIGYSLTYTISIGISAVLGTVLPLLLKGNLIGYFSQKGGGVILVGMILAMVGVALCGWAGFSKEKEAGRTAHFNMKAGLALTLIAGVLSGVFNISLEYGQPIADMAAKNGAGIFQGNANLIVSTAGCFLVNVVWFVILGLKQRKLGELKGENSISGSRLAKNFFWSAFAGILWCMQFFFFGLGHVKMGTFRFASWVIHMSMLIFFSFIIGMIMKEWKQSSRKTILTLIIALVVLCGSFCIMTYGSMMGNVQ